MSEIHTGDCAKILEELLHKYEWGSYKFFELMQKLCIVFDMTDDDCYHSLMEYPFTGNSNRDVCDIIIMRYTNKIPKFLLEALRDLERNIGMSERAYTRECKKNPWEDAMYKVFYNAIETDRFTEGIEGLARILGYDTSCSDDNGISMAAKEKYWDFHHNKNDLQLLENLVFSISRTIRSKTNGEWFSPEMKDKYVDTSDKLLYLCGRIQTYRNDKSKIHKEDPTMANQKCPHCPGKCPDETTGAAIGETVGESLNVVEPEAVCVSEPTEDTSMQKFETNGNASTSVLLRENGEVNVELLRALVDGNQFTNYSATIEAMTKMWRKFTPAMYKKTLLYVLDRFYIPHEKCDCGGSINQLKIGNGIFNHSCLCVNADWLDGPYIKLKTQHGSPASFPIVNGSVMDSIPYVADIAFVNAKMKYCKADNCTLIPVIFAVDNHINIREEDGKKFATEDYIFFFGVADKCSIDDVPHNTPIVCRALGIPELKVSKVECTDIPVITIDGRNLIDDTAAIAVMNTICGVGKPNPVPYFVEFMKVFTHFLQQRDESVDYANDVDRDPV